MNGKQTVNVTEDSNVPVIVNEAISDMLNTKITISTYIRLLIMSGIVKQNYFTLTACYLLFLVKVIKPASQTIFTACYSLEHVQESIKQTPIKYDLKIKGCTRNTHACFYLMSITQNINRLKKMQNSTFAWLCNLHVPWCQVISGVFRIKPVLHSWFHNMVHFTTFGDK